MPDLSQYGTVSSGTPDLSQYGTVSDPSDGQKRQGFGEAGKGFIEGAYSVLPGAVRSILHPIDALSGLLDAHKAQFDKASESLKRGDYVDAAQHIAAGGLPVIGPMASDLLDAATDPHSTADDHELGRKFGQIIGTLAVPKLAQNAVGAAGALKDAATSINPDVIREGMKILPKGAQMVKFYDAIKAAQPAEVSPETQALDGIAQGFKYKDFASAPGDAQRMIQNISDAMKRPAPTPMPRAPVAPQAPVSPVPAAAPPAAPVPYVSPNPPETIVAGRPLRAPLRSPAQPEVEAPAAAPSAVGKTEMESLLEKSLEDPQVADQAKAELADHLRMESLKKGASIIDRNQTQRALKLGRFLQNYAITPEHIASMTPEEWSQVGELAEVPKPSATTIQKVKDLYQMGAQ